LGSNQQHGLDVAANEADAQKKDAEYKERDPEKRIAYLRQRRSIVAERGSQDIVYIDECGFDRDICRRYGWSRRGHKVDGDHFGHRRSRTSLIAARRGKDVLAPMLFSGIADAGLVNDWTRARVMQGTASGLHPHRKRLALTVLQ
jgi:DDE superfamily endonuclease